MDAKGLGEKGEAAARGYLERTGLEIVDLNWRCRSGEIDIVALDGDTLVFCEVKTRKSVRAGLPEEAVSVAKQKRLVRLAAQYMKETGRHAPNVRFDVVTILVLAPDRALLRHHRSAFTL